MHLSVTRLIGVWMTLIFFSSVFVSCNSNNDVVGDHFIQKRKYRKGFHLNNGVHKTKRQDRIDLDWMEASKPQSIPEEHADPKRGIRERIKTVREAAFQRSYLLPGLGTLNPQDVRRSFKEKKPSEPLSEREMKEKLSERILHDAEPAPQEETEDDMVQEGQIALIAGVLTWVFALIGLVTNFIIPGLGFVFSLLALVLSIIAVIYGKRSKDSSDIGTIGFILGLIYLILTAIALLIFILAVIFIILIFAAAV